ncbi:MAG: hypothetical protein Q4F11_05690 [Eubacteriales bacterium]|nr:hypothetical protein [Eubacteriales bacterium]
MDIKLIKKAENSEFVAFDKDILLQITDADYQLNQYVGKHLSVLNTSTNERFEIAPEIKKYILTKITYACSGHDYLFFTSAERTNEDKVDIKLYRYILDDGRCEHIYTMGADLREIGVSLEIKIFALDIDHVIIEKTFYQSQEGRQLPAWRGIGVNEIVLQDIMAGRTFKITDSVIAESGIDKMVALGGNNCLIKLGNSMVGEKFYGGIRKEDAPREIIGIINVKQFISDLILDMDKVFIEELDSGTDNVTFPYVKKDDNWIIYSKFDLNDKLETIVFYNFVNKIKKIRINSNVERISDLSFAHVINDIPYQIRNEEHSSQIINMNTQKVEMKLSADINVSYVKNDIIVVQHKTSKLPFISRTVTYIEVYKYPDMLHSILKTKEKYNGCLCNGNDLIILTT